MGIKIGIGRLRIGHGSGTSWSAYWTQQKFQEGEAFDNGKLVIGLDDGFQSVFTYGMPLFREKGIKVTTYMTANKVGTSDAHGPYLTWDNINEMIAEGQDIQCHGNNGDTVVSQIDANLRLNYTNLNDAFTTNGVPVPQHTAYSGGQFNDRTLDITDDYRLTARGVNNGYVDRKSKKFSLLGCAFGTVLATSMAQMDYVKENKVAVMIWGHQIGVDGDGLSNTVAYVEAVIDYAQSIGLDIITLKQLYNLMFYIDLRVSRNCDTGTYNLFFKNSLPSFAIISIERSDDSGANFSEIATVAGGVGLYANTGITESNLYVYRVRALHNGIYLGYSNEVDAAEITLTITASGTGGAVAKLSLTPFENVILSLDGNGKFYTDAAGTVGESNTVEIISGVANVLYIRCSSGASNFIIPKNVIKSINEWTTVTNAPILGGSITNLTSLVSISVLTTNTLSGSITRFKDLTYFMAIGGHTIVGDITELTKLTYIELQQIGVGLSGSITNLTKLTKLSVQANTLSGSVSGLILSTMISVSGSNTLSGSISGLTSLTYLKVSGSNTITGSVTGLISLTYLNMAGGNTLSGDLNPIVGDLTLCYLTPCAMVDYTAGATWPNCTIEIRPSAGYGYSATEIDNMLIDMAASAALISQTITLKGSSAVRTAASNAAVATLTGVGRTNTLVLNP